MTYTPPRCVRCHRPDDGLNEAGLCWRCRSDADERAAICGGSGVCPDCDEGMVDHGLTCGTCLGTGDCPGCSACGDDCDNDCDDEQAPAPSPSSQGAGAAASLADPPLPLGSVGGAALDEAEARHLPTCPFCGGDPIEEHELRGGYEDGEADAWAYFVACRCCAAEGPWTKSAGSARRMWSMRHSAALDEARALLIALSEMDPCPDCGATDDERDYESPLLDGDHTPDCQIATWLRLYGSAP